MEVAQDCVSLALAALTLRFSLTKHFHVPCKVKGKSKAVPVLNKTPRHEDVLVQRRYNSTLS